MGAKTAGRWSDLEGFLDGPPPGSGLEAREDAADPGASAAEAAQGAAAAGDVEAASPASGAGEGAPSDARSEAVPEAQAISPPFLGSQVVEGEAIPLAEVFAYLDRNAQFAGQWQLRKSQQHSREDYEAMLAEKA